MAGPRLRWAAADKSGPDSGSRELIARPSWALRRLASLDAAASVDMLRCETDTGRQSALEAGVSKAAVSRVLAATQVYNGKSVEAPELAIWGGFLYPILRASRVPGLVLRSSHKGESQQSYDHQGKDCH
jgi:hypothetical protein